MIDFIITDKLSKNAIIAGKTQYVISLRELTPKEISFARQAGIRRYYLPSLSENESAEFFCEFDQFWDQVVKPFGTNHPFWRNVVSSKMQEWETSASYLVLTLFTISRKQPLDKSLCIIIVCSSIEEQKVCEEWSKIYGWKVHMRRMFPFVDRLRKMGQELRNAAYFFYYLLFLIRQKSFFQSIKGDKELNKISVLVASSAYSNSLSDGNYHDPFFCDIHKYFAANGHKCAYLSIPLEKLNSDFACNIKLQKYPPVYFVYSLIGWAEILFLLTMLFFHRLEIPQSRFMGCDLTKLLKWNSRRLNNSFNIVAALYYIGVSRLCKIHRFEHLLINFEGNVFERACIQAFRKSISGHITGYCQGVVFPQNLKLRLTSVETSVKPEPDIYICTGTYAKDVFERVGKRKTDTVLPGCSLRFIPTLNSRVEADTRPFVLVALDGVGNSFAVLDWLMEYSELLKEFQFIIRAHPNVPLERLSDQCINSWPNNFIFSTGNLMEDLDRSFCVIYRQTSIGIQALLNGIPAIHLLVDLPLPGDPLMELHYCRWIAKTPGQLVAVLKEMRVLSPEKWKLLLEKEKELLNAYFTIPDKEKMSQFLHY